MLGDQPQHGPVLDLGLGQGRVLGEHLPGRPDQLPGPRRRLGLVAQEGSRSGRSEPTGSVDGSTRSTRRRSPTRVTRL